MSPSAQSASGRARATDRRSRRRDTPLWWAFSLALHVSLYIALVALTPIREIIFPRKAAPEAVEVTLTGDRLEEVVDYIRERNANEVENQVEELLAIEDELEAILDTKTEEFEVFAAEKLADAPAEALEAQDAALKAQAKALEEQAHALEAQGEDDKKAAEAHQKGAEASQTDAREAQERAERALGWADPSFSQAHQAQKQAAEAQARAALAQRQARSAQRQAESRDGRARKSEASADKARAEAQKAAAASNGSKRAQRDAERAEQKARRAEEGARKAAEQARTAREQARSSQQEARRLQAAARDAQAAARNAAAAAVQAQGQVAQSTADTPPADAAKPRPDLASMDLADLYKTAADAEGRVAQTYKHVRATDLSMVAGMPLAQAMQSTQVAQPARPQLDAGLLRSSIRTGGALQAHKKEMEKAIQEIGSMASLGRRMLETARGLVTAGEDGFAVSLDQVHARAEQYQQMAHLAAEDAGARAKDLSSAMKAAAATGTTGTGTGPDTQGGHGDGKGGPSGPPGISPRYVKALPGRKILSRGTGADWMLIDSWYCIGPFPNPMRRYMDSKLAPETVVDLDGAYRGKADKWVRWEFMQSVTMPCVPLHAETYAIYYAYTEVYSDRPRDLWIAIGSDDKSKVWVEGHEVWVSGSQLKGWRVDEGFRKVHFRKGYNRILLRLENGHGGTAFSVCICVKPSR